MQLINERQRFPFVMAYIVTVFVIGIAFLATHLVDPTPALANTNYWYIARSAGFTSYGLLSLAVLLGVSSSNAFWDRWNMRKLMTHMHQYASLLVFPFLFFHLWGLYMDKTIPFKIFQFVVPFTSPYRSIPTALGLLSIYAWIVLIISSYFQEKIGVKAWRTLHVLSFPTFVAVTFHGLFTGTDSGHPWALLIYIIPSTLFVIFLSMRVRRTLHTRR